MQWKFSVRGNTYSDVLWYGSTFFKTFAKTFGWNCWKFFQGVETTLLSNFVLKSSCTSTFVWLSAENLLTFQKKCAYQNSVLLVPVKMFWIYSFWKIISINLLRLRSKSQRIFDGFFCAWLSKLHWKSLEEFCDDNCFW